MPEPWFPSCSSGREHPCPKRTEALKHRNAFFCCFESAGLASMSSSVPQCPKTRSTTGISSSRPQIVKRCGPAVAHNNAASFLQVSQSFRRRLTMLTKTQLSGNVNTMVRNTSSCSAVSARHKRGSSVACNQQTLSSTKGIENFAWSRNIGTSEAFSPVSTITPTADNRLKHQDIPYSLLWCSGDDRTDWGHECADGPSSLRGRHLTMLHQPIWHA